MGLPGEGLTGRFTRQRLGRWFHRLFPWLVLAGLPVSCIVGQVDYHRFASAIRAKGGIARASGDDASALLGRFGVAYVNFSDKPVGDDDLRELAPTLEQWPGLTSLDLRGTLVTDAGLVHLRGLSQLDTLGLVGLPGVTKQGVHNLQRALPRLRIAWRDEWTSTPSPPPTSY
jgi:hypothetical protein